MFPFDTSSYLFYLVVSHNIYNYTVFVMCSKVAFSRSRLDDFLYWSQFAQECCLYLFLLPPISWRGWVLTLLLLHSHLIFTALFDYCCWFKCTRSVKVSYKSVSCRNDSIHFHILWHIFLCEVYISSHASVCSIPQSRQN